MIVDRGDYYFLFVAEPAAAELLAPRRQRPRPGAAQPASEPQFAHAHPAHGQRNGAQTALEAHETPTGTCAPSFVSLGPVPSSSNFWLSKDLTRYLIYMCYHYLQLNPICF